MNFENNISKREFYKATFGEIEVCLLARLFDYCIVISDNNSRSFGEYVLQYPVGSDISNLQQVYSLIYAVLSHGVTDLRRFPFPEDTSTITPSSKIYAQIHAMFPNTRQAIPLIPVLTNTDIFNITQQN